MRRSKKRSKRALMAHNYPKSNAEGKPCFHKTIYPSLEEAEKGATIIWSREPSAKREDLHGYKCPDGCRGFHVGHKKYYEISLQRQSLGSFVESS